MNASKLASYDEYRFSKKIYLPFISSSSYCCLIFVTCKNGVAFYRSTKSGIADMSFSSVRPFVS